MLFLYLQINKEKLFDEIKTQCERYVKEHWQNEAEHGLIVAQSDYFHTLAKGIENMSKEQLDDFASTHIGHLYNLLLSTTVTIYCGI